MKKTADEARTAKAKDGEPKEPRLFIYNEAATEDPAPPRRRKHTLNEAEVFSIEAGEWNEEENKSESPKQPAPRESGDLKPDDPRLIDLPETEENIRRGAPGFELQVYEWSGHNVKTIVPTHWHEDLELMYFRYGHFSVKINSAEYPISDQTLIFIPARLTHSVVFAPDCSQCAVVFNPSIIDLKNEDALLRGVLPLMCGGRTQPVVLKHDSPGCEVFIRLFCDIARLGTDSRRSSRLLCKARLLEFFCQLDRYGYLERSPVYNAREIKKDKLLKDILEYLKASYKKDLSLEATAARYGLSTAYFSKFLSTNGSACFTDHVNGLRLRSIARELETTDKNPTEIALENGFSNVGYFFRVFKARFNLTPRQYRLKYAAKPDENAEETREGGAKQGTGKKTAPAK